MSHSEGLYQLTASSRSRATEIWRRVGRPRKGEAEYITVEYLKSGRIVINGNNYGAPDYLTVRYKDGEQAYWPILKPGEETVLPAQR